MVAQFGPFATIRCETRQVRKEATVAVQLGAEVWLGWVPSSFLARQDLFHNPSAHCRCVAQTAVPAFAAQMLHHVVDMV